MATQDLITLEEAAKFLSTGIDDETPLATAITEASIWIEQLTRRNLTERAYTNLRLTGPIGTRLYVPAWPISTTQAVTIKLDEVAQTVWRTEADGDVDSKDVVVASDDPWDERRGKQNHFYRANGWASALGFYWRDRSDYPPSEQLGQHRILLTYTGGYATVPEDLKRACKYLVQKLFARDQQKQLTGVSNLSFPGGAVGFMQTTDPTVPREVWSLINPYKRPEAFAAA